jgi:hypothetical protein
MDLGDQPRLALHVVEVGVEHDLAGIRWDRVEFPLVAVAACRDEVRGSDAERRERCLRQVVIETRNLAMSTHWAPIVDCSRHDLVVDHPAC